MERIVIVGASLAGLRAAERLVRCRSDATVTLIGEEPHFPPFDRPHLSKKLLTGEIDESQGRLRTDFAVSRTVLGDRATGLDLVRRIVATASGKTFPFDTLVIATGAVARSLPQVSGPATYTLRSYADCQAIVQHLAPGASVAVVGAGFIGCEVAASLRRLDQEVYLIEAGLSPLPSFGDSLLSDYVTRLHRQNGVNLRLGAQVRHLDRVGNVMRLRLDDESCVEASMVIVGVGAKPQTAWLDGSGLSVEDGVLCDATGRSVSHPEVFAIGDVARWWNPRTQAHERKEHWTSALTQAQIVAQTVSGVEVVVPDHLDYVWSDQHGVKIQMLGRAAAPELIAGDPQDDSFAVAYYDGTLLVGATLVNRQRLFPLVRRLLESNATRAHVSEALR